jgi:hypothetical protein
MKLEFADLAVKVPRDGRDKPVVIPEGGGKPIALTRVTTFIDCIEDKEGLAKWKRRCAVLGFLEKPGLLEAARDCDPETPEGKRKLDALVEAAVEASGANEKREKGTYLHALTELVDAGLPLPDGISDEDLQDMMAYMAATVHLTFRRREEFVVCSELGVGGTPDGVADYDGPGPDGKPLQATIITDLKTGSMEYGGIKMPAQLSIYSRSKLYDPSAFPAPNREEDEKAWQKWKRTVVEAEEAAKAYSEQGDINQDWGLIINLRPGSGEATLHWADLNIGWEVAQEAVDVRKMRSIKGGLRPWVPLERSVVVPDLTSSDQACKLDTDDEVPAFPEFPGNAAMADRVDMAS